MVYYKDNEEVTEVTTKFTPQLYTRICTMETAMAKKEEKEWMLIYGIQQGTSVKTTNEILAMKRANGWPKSRSIHQGYIKRPGPRAPVGPR